MIFAKLNAIKVAITNYDLPQKANFAVKIAMVAAFLKANRVTFKAWTPIRAGLMPAHLAGKARAMGGL